MSPIPRIRTPLILAVFPILILVLAAPLTGLAQTAGPLVGDLLVGDLLVTLTRLDDTRFPEITFEVSAVDQEGTPVTGLQAANLRISESGSPAAAELVSVEEIYNLPLNLVLVIDTGMAGGDLEQVKAAAHSLVAGLKPGDRLALLAYADQLQTLHGFDSPPAEALATLDGLKPGGKLKALHDIAYEAVQLAAGAAPGARHAVLILTNDRRENASQHTTQETSELARQFGVAVLAASFGPGTAADNLLALAHASGGRWLHTPGSADLESRVKDLEAGLRLGYRITFRSGRRADDSRHPFELAITAGQATGQAGGQLQARSHPLEITPPGLAAGPQTGVLRLSSQVASPAPPVTLRYYLDGTLLAETQAAPYFFDLDTALFGPGEHTLALQAEDKAGNTGETALPLLIAGPPRLTLEVSAAELMSGDKVTVQASLDSLLPIQAVEFFLDGKPLARLSSPPYQLEISFDATAAPGEHTLSVRAINRLGQGGEASRPVWLLAPTPTPIPTPTPTPTPSPARNLPSLSRTNAGLAAGVIGLLAATSSGLLLAWQRRKRRRKLRRTLGLELCNRGNIACAYQLRAEDPAKALHFQFQQHGQPLPLIALAAAPPPAVPASEPPAGKPKKAAPTAHPEPTVAEKPAAGPAKKGLRERFKGISARIGRASTFTTGLVGILRLLGGLLPGRLGAPFKSMSASISQGQRQVTSVGRGASMTTRTAQSIPTQLARLKSGGNKHSEGSARADAARNRRGPAAASPSTKGSGGSSGSKVFSLFKKRPSLPGKGKARQSASAAHLDEAELETEVEAGSPETEKTPPAPPVPQVMQTWAITPRLAPGEALLFDLQLDPLDPYRSGQFAFQVISQAEATAGPLQPPILVETSAIGIIGISKTKFLLETGALVGAVLLVGGLGIVFILHLGQFF